MTPFLKNVADQILTEYSECFKSLLVVVPNHRTAVFFVEHLKKSINKPTWVPKIKTIKEFIADFTELAQANPVELLSVLYKSYIKESKTKQSFDEFYFWGELMIKDFNDIDRYLVNPETVLKNVAAYKEVESNFSFLSEEQVNAIKRFLGNFDLDNDTKLKQEFLKVWNILLPVYNNFTESLRNEKIGYEGLLLKDVLANIEENNLEFSFEKIAFVGFNALTPAEEKIFKYFKNQQNANFYWDYDNYYVQDKQMEAGHFQRKLLKEFPPPEISNNNNLLGSDKKITLVSAPTNYGQIFAFSQLITELKITNYSSTAVVLSDENLLMPVLNHLPTQVDSINVTMGYPISNSLTVNFVNLLIDLQQTLRISKDDSKFYGKTALSLLQHPFIQTIDSENADAIIESITSQNLYYLTNNDLCDDGLIPLVFKTPNTYNHFCNYLSTVLAYIQLQISENETNSFEIEQMFIDELIKTNNQLQFQLTQNKLDLDINTYFRLLKKVLLGIRVPFEGEPVQGLQIMGFLETRNLDFENVFILSANEGQLPLNKFAPSFIPYGLRYGFGLPTGEFADAMYAYYFYRIIQRAKNIYLIYNSGSSGMQTGEKSRFAYQLIYDTNFNVTERTYTQSVEVSKKEDISVKKTKAIEHRLEQFYKGEKFLSPSSLSTYLICPLKFYFQKVARLNQPDEITDKVDARLFGNLFHKTAERLYLPFKESGMLLSLEEINLLQKDNKLISNTLADSFKRVFYGDKSTREFVIEGKNKIVFDVLLKYINKLLEIDKQFAPIHIVGLEQKVTKDVEVEIHGKMEKVHLGGEIDRLDKSQGNLRVIDYKTGGDNLSFVNLEDLFSIEKISDTKAVFQTFVYSMLVYDQYPQTQIKPMIYQVKNMFKDQVNFNIESNKCELFASGGFNNVKEDFNKHLQVVLEELFNPNVPFTQTHNQKNCDYCDFKNMCAR